MNMVKNNGLELLQNFLSYGVNELTNTKPRRLRINGVEQNFGTSWTDFTVYCVRQFVKNGDIEKDFTPLKNKSDKPILTSQLLLAKQSGFDHKFDMVSSYCYVDTKYNAKGHIQNIIKIMQKFGIEKNYRIELAVSEKM